MVLSLEKSIYLQRNVIGAMNTQLRRAQSPNYKAEYHKQAKYLKWWAFLIPIIFMPLVVGIIWGILSVALEDKTNIYDNKTVYILFAVIDYGVLIGMIVYDIYVAISNKRNNAVENAKVDDYNDRLYAYSRAKANEIANEIVKAKNELQRTYDVLQRVYSMNIIYSKYRSFVPVGMFYEYICSGRCSTLEGHEGAYNIYEYELRMDIIINELQEIKQNQWYLYDAISSQNKNFNRLYQSCISGMSTLNNISQNTDLIAYYSQIEANDINAIKWMKVFRY